MRLEFIGLTKGTIEDIDVQAMKMGQKDLVPAMAVTILTKQPNTFLNVIDPTGALRALYYEKNGQGAKTQQQLEGIEVITDLPQLTQLASSIGAVINAEYEQTGCTLIVHRGTARQESAIKLTSGTTSKLKIVCHDGGTCDVSFRHYVSDVDEETMGAIAVMKKHDIEFELTMPEVLTNQQELPDDDENTPEKALAKASGASDPAWPFPENEFKQADQKETPLDAKVKVTRPAKPKGKVHQLDAKRGKKATA